MKIPESGSQDLLSLRRIAEEAVARGSRIVARRFGTSSGRGEAKGAGDYVTSVDRESEEAIGAFLERETPDIPMLGEEEGGDVGDAYWAVDPLDGTTNFIIGLPVIAVSVAVVAGGRPLVGAVRAPLLDLSFTGARGLGAWAGGTRLEVSSRPPRRAIVATGFPFRHKSRLPDYLPALERIFRGTEDVRRAGAAALDLAWVASGVFDGFFELGLSVWDVAAGALLIEEAGGLVTDWTGGADYLAGDILAGSPATHAVLLAAAS